MGQQFPPHNHVVRQIYDYNTRVIAPRDEDKTRGAVRQGYNPRTTRPQWPDHPHGYQAVKIAGICSAAQFNSKGRP